MHFFEPELDTFGTLSENSRPPRAGTEFPIYSYIVALLYQVFGIHEVIGRLLSIVLTAWSALFLYAFIVRRLGETAAFWSGIFMCSIPVHIYFTRTFQPEPMALWGVLGFLDYTDRWIREGKSQNWIAALLLGAVAPLLKLPYFYLVAGLGFLLYLEKPEREKGIKGCLLMGGVIALTIAWYAWTKRAPAQVLPMGLSYHLANLAPIFTWRLWYSQFISRFPEICATYSGLLLGILGWRQLADPFFKRWWGLTVVYTLLCGEYGLIHKYTLIPWAPINAVFIATGFLWLWEKGTAKAWLKPLAILLAIGIPVHAAFRIKHWYRVERDYLFQAREIIQDVSAPQDLFFTNTDEHPVLLYYIDRYGYAGRLNSMTHEQVVDTLSKVQFILTPVDELWKANPEWATLFGRYAKLIHADTDYLLYEIR